MRRWTLHYSQEAIQAIYQVPRGIAAQVTGAIRNLALDPHPPGSQPLDRPNTYFLNTEDRLIVYELNESEEIIKILRIE